MKMKMKNEVKLSPLFVNLIVYKVDYFVKKLSIEFSCVT